jgi:hypothetical protein
MSNTSAQEIKEQELYVNDTFKKLSIDYKIDVTNNDNLLKGMFLLLMKLVPMIPGIGGTESGGSSDGWEQVTKKGVHKNLKEIKKEVRQNGDIADFVWQRGQKGNFIITSPADLEKGIKSRILPEAELSIGVSFEDHILKLIKETYGVSVPKGDIQACHPLGKNSAIIKIWNRRNGAAFHKLVQAVKCGGIPKPFMGKLPERNVGGTDEGRVASEGVSTGERKGEEQKGELGTGGDSGSGGQLGGEKGSRPNLFINFHLTRKRYALLGHLKKLKREKKISKFYTNENGDISIKIKHQDKKVNLTIDQNDQDSISFTYTPEDVDNLLKAKAK